MKLQVNLSGSWRDVLPFHDIDRARIQLHATRLLRRAQGRVSMRIADDKNVAIAHCAAPDFEWQEARGGR